MPHINVKLYPGGTEEQKQQLADAIIKSSYDFIIFLRFL